MMSLAVAKRVQLAAQPKQPVVVTFTFGNLRPGVVSAWDATRNAFGHEAFDVLGKDGQISEVRRYVNR